MPTPAGAGRCRRVNERVVLNRWPLIPRTRAAWSLVAGARRDELDKLEAARLRVGKQRRPWSSVPCVRRADLRLCACQPPPPPSVCLAGQQLFYLTSVPNWFCMTFNGKTAHNIATDYCDTTYNGATLPIITTSGDWPFSVPALGDDA
jgi:hypothetical protein